MESRCKRNWRLLLLLLFIM